MSIVFCDDNSHTYLCKHKHRQSSDGGVRCLTQEWNESGRKEVNFVKKQFRQQSGGTLHTYARIVSFLMYKTLTLSLLVTQFHYHIVENCIWLECNWEYLNQTCKSRFPKMFWTLGQDFIKILIKTIATVFEVICVSC